ncbi:hypothetical protein EDD22DRAFT_905871 [Suillus occidentalis]|nr:hypothetical protein EDD22DRAFT_905871 [Suillus occidentalis]
MNMKTVQLITKTQRTTTRRLMNKSRVTMETKKAIQITTKTKNTTKRAIQFTMKMRRTTIQKLMKKNQLTMKMKRRTIQGLMKIRARQVPAKTKRTTTSRLMNTRLFGDADDEFEVEHDAQELVVVISVCSNDPVSFQARPSQAQMDMMSTLLSQLPQWWVCYRDISSHFRVAFGHPFVTNRPITPETKDVPWISCGKLLCISVNLWISIGWCTVEDLTDVHRLQA